MTAGLNFFQNTEKSVCAKALGNNNRTKIPANQVCALFTRHGRQTRIDADELNSGKLYLRYLASFAGTPLGEQDAVSPATRTEPPTSRIDVFIVLLVVSFRIS